MNTRTSLYLEAAIILSGCQKDVPRSQMPHLADFCVQQSNWPKLLDVMRTVGARHGLKMHGGIEKYPDGPLFNAYIARGYSYWFGDDLDLWITSNPHDEGDMSLGGISKKPWTQADTEIARELMSAASPLFCERKTQDS